jgi:hypothetical protein
LRALISAGLIVVHAIFLGQATFVFCAVLRFLCWAAMMFGRRDLNRRGQRKYGVREQTQQGQTTEYPA